jgi:phosphoribosylformylglycinamidine cyclo-ligase
VTPKTYAGAGVDIDKGDRFAAFIKRHPSGAVSKSIGGFSGVASVDLKRYRDPLLLSTTDGVGTKLLVAQRLKKFDTVGIDLVAMCVNDLAVCGARPFSFLDYIAIGAVEETVLEELFAGIVRGCELAGCELSGGETAELPDMYPPGAFDLAGFASGVVERSEMLPRLQAVGAGDPIMALPSVGIHSNGLSLARKCIPDRESAIWEELLRPTKIYVEELLALTATGFLTAAAHITGGGLEANFGRVVPEGLHAHFSWSWDVPEIFETIRRFGDVDESEMRRVFNMGIGIAFIVPARDAAALTTVAHERGIAIATIGEIVRG